MKKSYLLLGILASLILLAMTACSSDDELTTPPFQATRYSLSDKQLRLYYNNQDYLLFNVR